MTSFVEGRRAALALGIVATLAMGCGNGQAATNAEIANLTGPDRARVLLEGAKKEGTVVLYSALNVDPTLRPLQTAFEAKHPGVKFEFWRGTTNEQVQKVTAEAQARNMFADLVQGATGAMPLIKANLAEPFTSPSLVAYEKGSYSAQGLWAPSNTNYFGLAYNKKLIPEGKSPKTYDDLLDPQWKDKMSWSSAAASGAYMFIATIVKSRGEKAAEDYFKKLAPQNMINDPAGLSGTTSKIAQGEYLMVLNASAATVVQLERKGAPVEIEMLDPIPTQINTINMLKAAPHPHAAMLFLDWYLSLEGQTLLASTGVQPAHPDVPPDEDAKRILPKYLKRNAYFETPEEVFEGRARIIEVYKKYFD